MICFNGEASMLEKISSPIFTVAMICSITAYIFIMNYFIPVGASLLK